MLIGFDQWKWFHASSCWEGPARSTAALVFDWTNFALCSPINISIGLAHVHSSISFRILFEGSQVGGNELFIGHTCELIDAHFVGLGLVSIVFVDNFNISLEYYSSVLLLNLILIFNPMSLFPFLKYCILALFASQEGCGGCKYNQSNCNISFAHICRIFYY